MQVRKRNGELVRYESAKIKKALEKAYIGCGKAVSDEKLTSLVCDIEKNLLDKQIEASVEAIQDLAETELMRIGDFEVAKAYILYRSKRSERRKVRQAILSLFPSISEMDEVLNSIEKDFGDSCPIAHLQAKLSAFYKENMSEDELLKSLIKGATELTTIDAPKWEMVSARLLYLQFELRLKKRLSELQIASFYEKLSYLTSEGLYGSYILENYSKEEIEKAFSFIDNSRNKLFTYSGLELMLKRYVIHDHHLEALETPQEMFLGVSLHLAMNEKADRLKFVKDFYDLLSSFKATMATPTLSNARKPYHQLSSCFIDTVPDSLDGIYRSIDNFAKVSKLGGGMGLYFGKVRATGSAIRGFEGAAGGVIRWIRLVNDTAVAVDQLGMRQGAVAVYLDVWHKDLPEFLNIRTNNGDDRMKAHDVFPAVCYPDYFWKKVKEDISSDWYLMCPYEIKRVKGYSLEDSYGEEWEKKYLDCVNDSRISKRIVPIKEIVRLVIRSAVETGTPFVFNRDSVNRMNPNKHEGIIYCSNLCTEIAQNMSQIETGKQYVKELDGETIVVNETKAGDFVVCNLASLSLGNIELSDEKELEHCVKTLVRALDNVIGLNYYPLPYAKISNMKYRSLGLGVSGYHHMLAKNGIAWESKEHLDFVDKLFEKINYYAIEESAALAEEKGRYSCFENSDWDNGDYFALRNYTSEKWQKLHERIKKTGLRNGYLLAVAPTSSTSILSGTTAGIDPIMNRFFLEEKKNGLMPRVAPELDNTTYWLYKNAHLIDQSYSIRACGIRQRHIDQAQSMNIYITNDYTFRQILKLYLLAWESGVKTLYYVRSKSLEVSECESCSS